MDQLQTTGQCDNGYACVYQNNLSWSTPTTPLPAEAHPRVVFERLFGEGGSLAERRAAPKDDFLQSLVDANEDGDRLSDEELRPLGRTSRGVRAMNLRPGDQLVSMDVLPVELADRVEGSAASDADDDEEGDDLAVSEGPWVLVAMKGLAHLKGLRGKPWDPFGWTAERRQERALIGEYKALVASVLERFEADDIDALADILSLAQQIKGFGHVKQASIVRYRRQLDEQCERFSNRMPQAKAA